MKKTAVDQAFLQLLVSTYNKSIQTYHHFPDVILCGGLRLEREEFELLMTLNFIEACGMDSFGRWYRLSKNGEAFLFQSLLRRRRQTSVGEPPLQCRLRFAETEC